ncbi:MAG: hypothetical protein ABSF77_18585 [Spirochaetia bacterium]
MEIAILARQPGGQYAGSLAGKSIQIPACRPFPPCPIMITDGTERVRLNPDYDLDSCLLWWAEIPFCGFSTIAVGQPADINGLLILAAWSAEAVAEPILISATENELAQLAKDQDAEPYPEGAERTRAIRELRALRLKEYANG